MKKTEIIAVAASILIPFLTSCDHKELCFDHWEHAARHQVNFQAEWDQTWEYIHEGENWSDPNVWGNYDFTREYNDLLHELPEDLGLRVLVYTDGKDSDLSNIKAEGDIVQMTPGEHQILFYNNNTEYIVFNDNSVAPEAWVTTRTRTRATYRGNSKAPAATRADEETVTPPDALFAAYIDSYTPEKSMEAPIEHITLRPLVFRYYIRFHFKKGVQKITVARGALAGMARNVYLTDGHTSSEPATILFDCEEPDGNNDYLVEAVVNTFGIPDLPNHPNYTRAPFYGLTLEVKLQDGTILNPIDFDITEEITKQPRGGVLDIYDDRLDIPEDIGNEGSQGAFGVAIDDWGEYQDVTFDIGKK